MLKRVLQENKVCEIFGEMNISYPLIHKRTCAYQGVSNVRFPENLVCFVFLIESFMDYFCMGLMLKQKLQLFQYISEQSCNNKKCEFLGAFVLK